MSTTNGNMEPGAKTDLVDLVGELEVALPEPEPEPEAEEGTPDSSWTKGAIQEWLVNEGIDYPSSATKSDLLGLVP